MDEFSSCAFWRQRSQRAAAALAGFVGKGERAHALLYTRASLTVMPLNQCACKQHMWLQGGSLAGWWSLQWVSRVKVHVVESR